VHAFIGSRLDYCNNSLNGVNNSLLKKLKAVWNAAARVTTETGKSDHIRPVLYELHRLPVRKRIIYKLVVIVYKCLRGLAPTYLVVDCVPVMSMASRQHLRSAASSCLAVIGTNTRLGTRNSAVTAAKIWSSSAT